MTPSSHEGIQRCLSIKSTEESFDCVKHAVKEATEACRPEIILLTQKGCPYCQEEKGRRQQEIQSGEIREIDVASEEGARIAQLNGIDGVPALRVVDCTGKSLEGDPPAPPGLEQIQQDIDSLLAELDS